MRKLLAILVPLLLLNACDDSPVFPLEPEISFVSITPEQTTQFTADEITLTLHYQDGDGDLGYEGTEKINNLYVTDTRDFFSTNPARTTAYSIPSLTPDTRKPSIQGDISISIMTPPAEPNAEPLVYEVYIVDRAGNISNVITTTPIIVNP